MYVVNSPEVKLQPQGGRWFHVLPLLRTGARVILSDSDVAWIRDPRPYLKQIERLHPRIDFTVSSDQQHATDNKPLRRFRRRKKKRRGWVSLTRAPSPTATPTPTRGMILSQTLNSRRGGVVESIGADEDSTDLDVEAFGACWQSMNIGIMHFPPGGRAGSIEAMEQAVSHLSQDNNLLRVDQGPINYRWKFGAGKWRWERTLHKVDGRLCGLVNGTVVGAVLPSAQFCNTLTFSVLKLWQPIGVRPFAVHATWMRQQEGGLTLQHTALALPACPSAAE